MKKALLLLPIMAILFSFTQCKDAKDAVITKFMDIQATQVNKKCPLNIGNGITMEKCTVEENKTFKFTFSVIKSYAKLLTINDGMKPMLLQQLKALPEFKQIKEYGISCIYAFHDEENNNSLGEIKVTPEDYELAETMQIDEAEEMIKMMVSSVAPNLPAQIDEITTLTACNALPDNKLEYVYSISLAKKDMDSNFEETMRSNLKQVVRNTPQIKKIVDTGVEILYVYNDKNGEELCRIKIASSDL